MRNARVAEKSALLRAILKVLIERESASSLALLGGGEPDLRPIPRRRLGKDVIPADISI